MSMWWYRKRIYLKDRNMQNLAIFTVGSLFGSFYYGRLFESAYTSAAIKNNYYEIRH